ncbi:TetR/AcrR family transcriptional regulator [Blastococcus sp. SYSU D00695]
MSRDGRILRGERTRALILEAATDLFGARSFESVSMKDVAARAGIGAPAVYNHFPSKEAVLVAALTAGLASFRAEVVALDDPSAAPWDRLETLVRRHVRQQLHSGIADAVDRLLDAMRAGQLLTDPAERAVVQAYLDDYRRLLGEVLERVRATTPGTLPATPVLVQAVIALCDRAPGWYPDRATAARRAEEDCWALVSQMLRAR